VYDVIFQETGGHHDVTGSRSSPQQLISSTNCFYRSSAAVDVTTCGLCRQVARLQCDDVTTRSQAVRRLVPRMGTRLLSPRRRLSPLGVATTTSNEAPDATRTRLNSDSSAYMTGHDSIPSTDNNVLPAAQSTRFVTWQLCVCRVRATGLPLDLRHLGQL
jgi:hypothetical protein